ncbi:MAG TPA: ABC transporter permease [Candidatus Saccharimonadales bacterium]|nr:ABC transporter permease [Candidatus Saccharimonadales bacterium]
MYHVRATAATTRRIMKQLSHDPRTLALIFVVPIILLSLLKWLYSDSSEIFNRIGPAFLGLFPFIIMFLLTSITTLRERAGGTFERLMTTPIGKADLIFGYMITFGMIAVVQALIAATLLLYGLDISIQGPEWFMILMAVVDALLGTALGLLVSAFAQTEFQAVQFMPAFIFPQLLLGGLLVPLAQMPDALESIAYYLPLTYALDALNGITKNSDITGEMWRDLYVVGGCIIVALFLGALTLRRRTR